MAILLIDMDEVVANLNGYAVYLHEAETGEAIDPASLDSWEKNGEVLRDYYLRGGIYRKLSVAAHAQGVLKDLSKNHRIFFVTAAPTPLSAYEKKAWVDEHFPFIGHMNVITTRDKDLIRGDLLLDDSPAFLPQFPGTRVLMKQPHNRSMARGKDFDAEVNGFVQFYALIKHLEVVGSLSVSSPEELERHAKRPLT